MAQESDSSRSCTMETAVLKILQEVRSSQATLQKDHKDLQRRLTEWMEQLEVNSRAPPRIANLDSNRGKSRSGNKATSQYLRHEASQNQFKLASSMGSNQNEALPGIAMSTSIQNAQLQIKKDTQRRTVLDSHEFAAKSPFEPITSPTVLDRIMKRTSCGHRKPHIRRSPTNLRPRQAKLQHCVRSMPFVLTFSVLILLNAICIGLEVNHRAQHSRPADTFKVMTYFFFVAFTIELFIRVIAFESSFFFGRDAHWNWFDCFMALTSVTEVLEIWIDAASSGIEFTQFFRIMKMARLMRIFRVMRFSPQLRMMLYLILEALKSMGFLVCLLFSFLYLFSIIFTIASTEYVGVPGSDSHRPNQRYATEVKKNFGSVLRSMFTCWKSMAGGVSWGEVVDPLLDMDMGWLYCMIFIIFIVFSVLCFMNAVTGVFVDGSMEKFKNDREMIVEKHLREKQAYVESMQDLFNDADSDGSCTISATEFREYLTDANVQAYFDALKVDTNDIQGLFKKLDKDGSGEIEVDEFIDSLLLLMRAHSPEQYLQKIRNESRAAMRNLLQVLEHVRDVVYVINASVQSLPGVYRECTDELELALRSVLHSHTPRPEWSEQRPGVATEAPRSTILTTPRVNGV